MILLLPDTNTLNYVLKGRRPAQDRLDEAILQGCSFLLASITHYELVRYFRLKEASRLLRSYELLVATWQRCELAIEDWDEAARVWADRHKNGCSISDLDLLLAVIARRHGAVLVTSNTRHFEGLGIPLADWSTGP